MAKYEVIRDYIDWETHEYQYRHKVVEYDDDHAALFLQKKWIKHYEPPIKKRLKLR